MIGIPRKKILSVAKIGVEKTSSKTFDRSTLDLLVNNARNLTSL